MVTTFFSGDLVFQTPDLANNFLFNFLLGIAMSKRVPYLYKFASRSSQLDEVINETNVDAGLATPMVNEEGRKCLSLIHI